MIFSLFNKTWRIYLLLFLCSFGFYAFYYHQLLFHLNNVIVTDEGDSLKNYYTYIYHIRNDHDWLNFSGMNFPFGEHIVYTDCQPLLTFILRILPFTHGYAIGIMHGLILFSFMITPLILFRIFRLQEVNTFPAFLSSLAVAMLSPQIQRLGGHFALAYGCIIPLGILFLLNYFRTPGVKNITVLIVYSCLLFLIHPYFGLGISVFCLISVLLREFLQYRKDSFRKQVLKALVIGITPILCFKIFMAASDHHSDRPAEPYGVDIMDAAANLESVFTPSFGPFDHFLKSIIKSKHVEWEALSYIGIFPFFLLLVFLLSLPFYFRKFSVTKELAAMFISASLFLLISFGLHIQLLQLFKIQISTLNQFRAFGRFAWYFYFLLPLFLIPLLTNFSKQYLKPVVQQIVTTLTGILFLSFNLLEAHHLLSNSTDNVFQARNIFNENLLSHEEKEVLADIQAKNPQALIPFPLFHIGSEVYQRNGEKSIMPAMLYSFHARLPILSVMLSRTSLGETEKALELLNWYKKNRPIEGLISSKPLLVIKTGEAQMEDELRILRRLKVFRNYKDQEFYMAYKSDFTLHSSDKNKFMSVENSSDSTKNIIFIPFKNRKPFTTANISDFEKIMEVDSNTLAAGDYVASFHYYLREKKFRYIHNNLIVIKIGPDYNNWEYFNPVRSSSGFYRNFIVFEQRLKIDPHFKYEFILNGALKEPYRISDFLLRPEFTDVKIIQGKTLLYNNYPD